MVFYLIVLLLISCYVCLHRARYHLVAQVLQQVVANDSDDGVEERHVFNCLVAGVAPLEVVANAGSEVVADVVVKHVVEDAEHLVVDAKLIFDNTVAQSHKELVEFLDLLNELVAHLNLIDRAPQEEGILDLCAQNGVGFISFSPLAQGLLTGKYDNGIPEGSRAARSTGFLQQSQVTEERVEAARKLGVIAKRRGQSMAQMALAWVLSDERVTSLIIGTSSVAQLNNNLETLNNLKFSDEEMAEIDAIISDPVLWF